MAILGLGVRSRDFVIDGVHEPQVPSEGALHLARDGDQWAIGVQERGYREAFALFATEEEACAALLADRCEAKSKGAL